MIRAKLTAGLVLLQSLGACASLPIDRQSVEHDHPERAVVQPHPDQRPNILFIMTDDHAIEAISAYGGRFAQLAPTPNIDQIALSGMRFDRATVTNSICAPSRAVILTGKHSHLNGLRTNGDVFDGSQQTFPKLMQQAQYQTAFFGKWHLKSQPTGFDTWAILPGQGAYYNPDFITPDGQHRETGYVTELVTDKAVEWLEKSRDSDAPFLLMVQHKAPHRSFMPGPDHLNLYADVEFPEPANLYDDFATRSPAARTSGMSILHNMTMRYDLKVGDGLDDIERRWDPDGKNWQQSYGRMTPQQKSEWDSAFQERSRSYSTGFTPTEALRWKYQHYMRDYLATVAAVDVSVGRLLDALERLNLSENTLVIYTSDQGFYLGEHGWFDKRFMYEESFRTPLLMRWPGRIGAGTTSARLVSNLDYAQTILDVAGIDQADEMQGRSLVPLFEPTQSTVWRDSLYYYYYGFPSVHHVEAHEGVATDDYKLIHFLPSDQWELYERHSDPHEMKNLYDQATMGEIVVNLKHELDGLKRQYAVTPKEFEGVRERLDVGKEKPATPICVNRSEC